MRPRKIALFLVLALLCHYTTHAQRKLFGIATGSGPGNYGVLFSIYTDGTNYQILHSFTSGTDGANPGTSVTMGTDTKLYGATSAGGANNSGTIYSYDTVTQVYQKVADLSNNTGTGIGGSLTFFNNKFYGLTSGGGANGVGTIVSYDPATGMLSKVFDFNINTGAQPSGGATVYNNKLYFASRTGGANNAGTIMAYDPAAGACFDVYDLFLGEKEFSDLAMVNNVLYGSSFYTESTGDASGDGYLYSFDPLTRTYRELFNFALNTYSFGRNPNALISYNGLIYGTSFRGGSNDDGTIFSLDPSTGVLHQLYAWLHDFSADQGFVPSGNLMITPDGLLVGGTKFGGTSNAGSIYTYDLNSGYFQKIFDFDIANGSGPIGGMYLPGH